MELRPARDEELAGVVRAGAAAFGVEPAGDGVERLRSWLDRSRSRAAVDGGEVVGFAASIPFSLTVPGPATVAAAGLTWVSVVPTHRRRGLFRSLVEAVLADAAERGEPVAVLSASESLLYGRFGFGPATWRLAWELDRRHAGLADRAPGDPGSLALLEPGAAAGELPAVFDRVRRRRPGEVDRNETAWALRLGGDGPPATTVAHRAGGAVDGYARYRVESAWDHGLPAGRLVVEEVVAETPAAEAALWGYLLALDLTEVVEAPNRPVDEPLRWRLADPRRLRARSWRDELWVNLVDIARALAARRYAVDGSVTLEVAGAGRFRLDGGPGQAECRPTRARPDLAVDRPALASLYLDGVSPAALAAAGRLVELRAGALARAGALFAPARAPFCASRF